MRILQAQCIPVGRMGDICENEKRTWKNFVILTNFKWQYIIQDNRFLEILSLKFVIQAETIPMVL